MASRKKAPRVTKALKAAVPQLAMPSAPASSSAPAEDRYVADLIARGEAARAVDGELPDGATHEIVEDEQGRLTVVRRRFFSIG